MGRNSKHKLNWVATTMNCMANTGYGRAWGNVQKLEPQTPFNFKDVMAGVKNERIAKDTDWVSEIGPGTCIAYGCSKRGAYPLRANHCYRLSSSPGADGCVSDNIKACGKCAVRREDSETLHTRLFVYQSIQLMVHGKQTIGLHSGAATKQNRTNSSRGKLKFSYARNLSRS